VKRPRTHRTFAALAALSPALFACAAARLSSQPLAAPPDRRGPTVLVVEPFFEVSQWTTTRQAERATVYTPGGYGGSPYGYSPYNSFYGGPMAPAGMPVTTTIYRDVPDKPPVSRVPALAAEQQMVIREIQRLRPNWQVLSTSAVQALSGPMTLVRVILGDSLMTDSDRTLKNMVSFIGLGIPAIFTKVHETVTVQGGMIRYETDADAIKGHLLRYATQPDFAVDTRGMTAANQTFGLDVSYEEGVFGPDVARDRAVVEGFAQRLALAVVALAESQQPP
jgi:hypothetical protein